MTTGTGYAAAEVLTANGLARTFGTGRRAVVAVHGVTCTVRPGARIALTGPSGSGKSTLLHLLAGLDAPTSGTLAWPLLGGHPRDRSGRIGMVFQGPSLVPSLDALENVALGLLLAGVEPDEATDRAATALARVGLGEQRRKLPEELSGGQAQRVAVARAVATRPVLILADEPTGQLDHVAAGVVLDVLLDTSLELGAAVVVSTHDPRIAARLETEWRMADGRLLSEVTA